MTRRIKIEHQREVITYASLWHASGLILKTGQRLKSGLVWYFMSSIVLSAFAYEAYLNHLGAAVFQAGWGKHERDPSHKKLKRLAKHLGVNLGRQKDRPLATIRKLVEVRNTLAHGRSVTLTPDPTWLAFDDPDYERHMYEHPLTEWEKLARTDDFAIKVRTDLEDLLGRLNAALPDPENLFVMGVHSSGASVVDA